MTSRIGNRAIASSVEPARQAAFTLIELILIMAILVVMLAVSAPSLSRFFRGRALDSEVQRFLALTRYGQSRAVSEGVPVLLWIDRQESEYGMQLDSSYEQQDPKAVEYAVHKDVQLEVQQSKLAEREATLWKGRGGLATTLPKIRFLPDGTIGTSSPERIIFRQITESKSDGEIAVGLAANQMNYEIQTNQPALFR